MLYNITDIYNDVRTVIDEIALNDADFVGDQDNSEMQTIIRHHAVEAADHVHLNADLKRFANDAAVVLPYPGTTERPGCSYVDSDNVCHITTDYQPVGDSTDRTVNPLRMLWANVFAIDQQQPLQKWSYPVTSCISDTDNEYAEVRDPYTGATIERPAVVYRTAYNDQYGGLHHEFELWKLDAQTDHAIVVVMPHAEITVVGGAEKISVDKNLYDAFIRQLAALTLTTYNEHDRAASLFQLANMEMGIEPQQTSPTVQG